MGKNKTGAAERLVNWSRGQRQRWSVVVTELRRARKRGIDEDDHQRGSGGEATRTVMSRGHVALVDEPPWKISQRKRAASACQPTVLRWKAISRHCGARFQEKFGCEWAGIDRTDDRFVKHTDTAPDLFPLSPLAVAKAEIPSFQLGKQLSTMELIDLRKRWKIQRNSSLRLPRRRAFTWRSDDFPKLASARPDSLDTRPAGSRHDRSAATNC